jgi:endonuclease YncB( thermonuclease family)
MSISKEMLFAEQHRRDIIEYLEDVGGRPTWTARATVLRIVDGDTFVADMDLGWGVWRREMIGAPSRVRLLRYRAPEMREPRGPEAKALLSKMLPLSARVWCQSHSFDSFGRALCDVFFLDGTPLLNVLNQEWIDG